MSCSVDNGSLMSVLKRQSMLDELSSLLPWANCWQRERYQWAKLQATTCQRAFVVIIVDWVRSNQNYITCWPWPCSWFVMLATNADFLTPGDPLIQITLWPSVFLIPCSICCKMSRQVPSIHRSRKGSLSPPRVLTKSPNSFFSSIKSITYTSSMEMADDIPWRFVTESAIATSITDQLNGTINIGIETRPCFNRISIRRAWSNFFVKTSNLSHNLIDLLFWAATRMCLTRTNESE